MPIETASPVVVVEDETQCEVAEAPSARPVETVAKRVAQDARRQSLLRTKHAGRGLTAEETVELAQLQDALRATETIANTSISLAELNERRLDLIDRMYMGDEPLSPDEEAELAQLQDEVISRTAVTFSRPKMSAEEFDARLDALEARLDAEDESETSGSTTKP